MNVRLILGSRDAIMMAALKEACAELGLGDDVTVEGVEPDEELVVRPYGKDEIAKSANALAKHALSGLEDPPPPAWGVGIENGVEERADGERGAKYYDHAVIALLSTDGSIYFGVSESVDLPTEAVLEAKERDVAVGTVIAEQAGCAPDDPHSFLTGGKRSRKAILKEALVSLITYVRAERGELD